MRYILSIFVLALGLSSCSTNHFVYLKSDGTARVSADFDIDLIQRIEKSEIISNIDTSKYRTEFTINDIDSIGNYMPFHKTGFLKFQNFGDSITISTGHTNPYQKKIKSCCHLFIRIRTEKPMEAYKANGKKIRKKKAKKYHGIWLRQTINQQMKGKKNINVILK